MPLFDMEAETQRKENLQILEDKRIAFAEKLEKDGITLDKMIACSNERGSFVAVAAAGKRFALITSPIFGQEGDFTIELFDKLVYRTEDVFVKGTGLNGALGFGKKAASGTNYYFMQSNGEEVAFELVSGRNSFMECDARHNPLTKTKRRRGNANIVWDFAPLDRSSLEKVGKHLGALIG